MSHSQNVLITIPISHFCEKARWALERAGIPYSERAHLQIFHWLPVWRAGGGRTAPVFVTGGRALPDSADIVAHADAHAPPDRRLYPTDAAARKEIRALEADFDTRLGPQARLWMYDQLRGNRDLAVDYGCTGVPAWQRRVFPYVFPAAMKVIGRYLGISPAAADQAEADVRATFDEVAGRLADGRPFLCGNEFTAADLTFASLSAAVLMPPEYGVPLPQPEELPAGMAAVVEELREHPAGAHALRMFSTQRRLA